MEPRETQSTPTSMHAQKPASVEVPEAPEAGFSGWTVLLLAAAVVLLVLRGLFTSITLTSDDPSEGLIDTTVWFGWLGITALSLALIGAGFTGKQASPGGRIALILVGVYFLQAGSAGVTDFLANLFRAF